MILGDIQYITIFLDDAAPQVTAPVTKSQTFSDQVGPFTPAHRARCAHGLHPMC